MEKHRLHKLFQIVNQNPLEDPFFPLRRWRALPWFTPKPIEASVLFIDMSASVWSKMDHPMIWQENIYTLHERATRIIRTCKGRVSKFIGDCVMATFTGQNHDEHALWCAAALLETFGLLREFFEPDMDSTLWRFPVTIGVTSGPVYFLYWRDAFGLPVDLAARLQGAAKPSTALIHELTVKNAGKAVEESPLIAFIGERSTVTVKSFGEVGIIQMSRPKQ
jgi:class 3 adenylate cyclase